MVGGHPSRVFRRGGERPGGGAHSPRCAGLGCLLAEAGVYIATDMINEEEFAAALY